MAYNTLELFAGIGGFSLGLEATGGFKTVAFCEKEPFCQHVLRQHWHEPPIYSDVRELTAEKLKNDGVGKIKVITAGFPCQDISTANQNGAGIAGERSGLWSEVSRLGREIRPKYIILENSPNILNRGIERVLADLTKGGFDCEWFCLSAAFFGAIHRRARWFCVAYPDDSRPQRRSALTNTILKQIQPAGGFERVRGRRDLPQPLTIRSDDGFSSRSHRIKALGNAVCPPVARAIGEAILKWEATA